MNLYFTVLLKSLNLNEYFTIFVCSTLQTFVRNLPFVYVHLIDPKSFLVYFGTKGINYILFDDADAAGSKQPCLLLKQENHLEKVGLRVTVKSDSSKITIEVDLSQNVCFPSFPTLLKMCLGNPEMSLKSGFNTVASRLLEYINKPSSFMHYFLLGQFKYAACGDENPNHKFWTYNNFSLNSSIFLLSNIRTKRTCALAIDDKNESKTSASIQRVKVNLTSTDLGDQDTSLFMCTLKPMKHDLEVGELIQLHNLLSISKKTIRKFSMAEMSAIFEGYYTNEWNTNVVSNETSMTAQVLLTSFSECKLLILSEAHNSAIFKKYRKALNPDIQNLLIELFLENPQFSKTRLVNLVTTETFGIKWLSKVVAVNQFVHKNNCSKFCDKSTTTFCKNDSNGMTCFLTKKQIPMNLRNGDDKCNINGQANSEMKPYTEDTEKRIKLSISANQWKITDKVWVSYFFRDTVASEIELNMKDQNTIAVYYPENIQQTHIPNFPQNLLTLVHLFKNWRKNVIWGNPNKIAIRIEQIELDLRQKPLWTVNILNVNQEFRAKVSASTGRRKIVTNACSVSPLNHLKRSENLSESFSAKNFPNSRQLGTDGEFINGTRLNDAFILTTDLQPNKNQSIFGMGGRDCVFVTKNNASNLNTIQISAGDRKLDLTLEVDKKSYPITISYHQVVMLSGRENVSEKIILSSCSLHMLDTKGGNKAVNDVIVVDELYRPCKTALKMFVSKNTNVFNYAMNGKFVYQISPTATNSSFTFKRPTNIFLHSVSHHIFTNVASAQVEIKSHYVTHSSQEKLVFEIILEKLRVIKVHYEMNKVLTCSKIRLIFTDGVVMTLDRTVHVDGKLSKKLSNDNFTVEKLNSLLHGYLILSHRTYSTANLSVFKHFRFGTTNNFAELRRGRESLKVFVINPNYRTEIDYRGEYFLVDITPNCVTNISNLECHFETVHLKRMPTQKLIISMSDACFALIEKQAMLEPAVFHDLNNSTLAIKVESVEQDSSRRLMGSLFVNLGQFLNYQSEEILFELETLMRVSLINQDGPLNLKPVPLTVDDDTHLVILLPDVTVRPMHFELDRYIHSFKCYSVNISVFVVAFECVKDDDECGPNLTFLLFDYNSVVISKFAFPNLEISSQGDNFKLIR